MVEHVHEGRDNALSKTLSPGFSPREGPDSRVGTDPVEVLGVFAGMVNITRKIRCSWRVEGK